MRFSAQTIELSTRGTGSTRYCLCHLSTSCSTNAEASSSLATSQAEWLGVGSRERIRMVRRAGFSMNVEARPSS
jgi:hypothetical protein